MSRYLSGKKRVAPFSELSGDRDKYLSLEQAEPNLGYPSEKPLPLADKYYNLVTIENGTVYDRYWLETAPGTFAGAISIFDEGLLVGTANSISKINFVGSAVSATANPLGDISTVRVFAPGAPGTIIFNDANDFASASNIYYNKTNQRVGINTSLPTTSLDINGGVKLQNVLYDSNNNVGLAYSVLISTGAGVSWTNPAVTGFKRTLYSFISTNNQTTFTFQYTQENNVDVYLNGVHLPTTDYTLTGGTTLILDEPLAAGESVDIISYNNAGAQGTAGENAGQGTQGIQGLQGNQGLQGHQGVQGNQSTQGSQGAQASQGTQGLLGTQGTQGRQGLQSSQGSQGTQGASNQGAQGTPGQNAGQGTQGLQGLQGTQGNQSTQGTQGTPGQNAGQGTQGSQGTQGASNQGAQGTPGQNAGQGTQGSQGTSVQGSQGTQGFSNQGTQGLAGQTQGTQGNQGTQGLSNQGAQGIAGQNAGQGTQGTQSTQGTIGNQGTQGIAGQTQGTQGSQGVQGRQGTQGNSGIQGNTGSPGTSVPSGTAMIFCQAAAPTGWTKVTTHNDKALRVVSGTGGGSGGSFTFSSVFTNRGVSGSVGNTTLDISQIPSHNHGGGTGTTSDNHVHSFTTSSVGNHNHRYGFAQGSSGAINNGFAGISGVTFIGNVTELEQSGGNDGQRLAAFVANTEGAGAHNHIGATDGQSATHTHSVSSQGGGGSHTHSFSGSVDFSVQYVDVIIATKD